MSLMSENKSNGQWRIGRKELERLSVPIKYLERDQQLSHAWLRFYRLEIAEQIAQETRLWKAQQDLSEIHQGRAAYASIYSQTQITSALIIHYAAGHTLLDYFKQELQTPQVSALDSDMYELGQEFVREGAPQLKKAIIKVAKSLSLSGLDFDDEFIIAVSATLSVRSLERANLERRGILPVWGAESVLWPFLNSLQRSILDHEFASTFSERADRIDQDESEVREQSLGELQRELSETMNRSQRDQKMFEALGREVLSYLEWAPEEDKREVQHMLARAISAVDGK